MEHIAEPMVMLETGMEVFEKMDPAFPCFCYRSQPSAHEVPWHWHEELEFVTVRSGHLVYAIDGVRHVLGEGDAAFVNSSTLHAEFALGDESDAYESGCTVDAALLYGTTESALYTKYFAEFLSDAGPSGFIARADGTSEEQRIAEYIRHAIDTVVREDQYFEAIARETFTKACLAIRSHHLSEGARLEDARPLEFERVKAMMEWLRERHRANIYVRDIAQAFGMSERECQREFSHVIGMSPKEYLLSYRLSVATTLLTTSTIPLARIAAECGFASQSYFSRAFKARFGHSPSDHRKRYAVGPS